MADGDRVIDSWNRIGTHHALHGDRATGRISNNDLPISDAVRDRSDRQRRAGRTADAPTMGSRRRDRDRSVDLAVGQDSNQTGQMTHGDSTSRHQTESVFTVLTPSTAFASTKNSDPNPSCHPS